MASLVTNMASYGSNDGNVNYYEKMKLLQEKQHESELRRIELEQRSNTSGMAERMASKLKTVRLQSYWKKICDDEVKSRQRNEQLLRELDRLDVQVMQIDEQLQFLNATKAAQETAMSRLYPHWSPKILQSDVPQQLIMATASPIHVDQTAHKTLPVDRTDGPHTSRHTDSTYPRDDRSSVPVDHNIYSNISPVDNNAIFSLPTIFQSSLNAPQENRVQQTTDNVDCLTAVHKTSSADANFSHATNFSSTDVKQPVECATFSPLHEPRVYANAEDDEFYESADGWLLPRNEPSNSHSSSENIHAQNFPRRHVSANSLPSVPSNISVIVSSRPSHPAAMPTIRSSNSPPPSAFHVIIDRQQATPAAGVLRNTESTADVEAVQAPKNIYHDVAMAANTNFSPTNGTTGITDSGYGDVSALSVIVNGGVHDVGFTAGNSEHIGKKRSPRAAKSDAKISRKTSRNVASEDVEKPTVTDDINRTNINPSQTFTVGHLPVSVIPSTSSSRVNPEAHLASPSVASVAVPETVSRTDEVQHRPAPDDVDTPALVSSSSTAAAAAAAAPVKSTAAAAHQLTRWERKSECGLTFQGFKHLLQTIENEISRRLARLLSSCYRERTSSLGRGLVEEICDLSNRASSNLPISVERQCDVLLDQLPSLCVTQSSRFLLSDDAIYKLLQAGSSVTEADVRVQLHKDNIELWDRLYAHLAFLVQNAVINPGDLAATFTPLLVSSESRCSRQAIAIISNLLEAIPVDDPPSVTSTSDFSAVSSPRRPIVDRHTPRQAPDDLLESEDLSVAAEEDSDRPPDHRHPATTGTVTDDDMIGDTNGMTYSGGNEADAEETGRSDNRTHRDLLTPPPADTDSCPSSPRRTNYYQTQTLSQSMAYRQQLSNTAASSIFSTGLVAEDESDDDMERIILSPPPPPPSASRDHGTGSQPANRRPSAAVVPMPAKSVVPPTSPLSQSLEKASSQHSDIGGEVLSPAATALSVLRNSSTARSNIVMRAAADDLDLEFGNDIVLPTLSSANSTRQNPANNDDDDDF